MPTHRKNSLRLGNKSSKFYQKMYLIEQHFETLYLSIMKI